MPGSPIRLLGAPRSSLAGGQSDLAGAVEQGPQRRDGAAQLSDVVAEALAEAAGFEEVALHVDDEQRGGRGVEGERVRARIDGGHRGS